MSSWTFKTIDFFLDLRRKMQMKVGKKKKLRNWSSINGIKSVFPV